MSFTDNLMAFNSQIEAAIADIPQDQVLNDPNIYRLVKLLSWSKQAAGSTSGGGGGTTSPMDIASGINAATDIDAIIAELESISTNTASSSGPTQAEIKSAIETATSIGTTNDTAAFTFNSNGSIIALLKGVLGKFGDATNNFNLESTLFGYLKALKVGTVTNLIGIDETVANGSSINLAALIPNAATRWVTGYTFLTDRKCLLSIDQGGGGGNLAKYYLPSAGGIEKVLAHPHISNSTQSLGLTITEADAPVRITGQLELRRA